MKRFLFVGISTLMLFATCSKDKQDTPAPVTISDTWQYARSEDTVIVIYPYQTGQKVGDVLYYAHDFTVNDKLNLNPDSTFLRVIDTSRLAGKWSLSPDNDTLILHDNGTGAAFRYPFFIKEMTRNTLALYHETKIYGNNDYYTVTLKR